MKKKVLSLFLVLSMLFGMLAMMPISVSAATEYIIEDVDDWIALSEMSSVGEATITVTAKVLDFKNETVAPIKGFRGTFNGNGVVIKNMNVSTTGETGLFRCPSGNVKIENIVITDSYFKGKQWVGTVLCCTGDGEEAIVNNVYVTSTVTVEATRDGNSDNAGGIIGGIASSTDNAYVSDCVFEGYVKATDSHGGIVGLAKNTLSISNSLATGKVDARGSSCGIVGKNSGTVNLTNCIYAGGAEGEYFNSYPLISGGTVNVTNCYTTHADHSSGYEGVVYKNSAGTLVTYKGFGGSNDSDQITYLNKSKDSLIGLNAIDVTGFTKRDGEIMLPNGVAGFDLNPETPEPEEPATLNGSGTEADPYKIGSAEDWAILETLAETKTFANEYIELTNDIDFDGAKLHPAFCEMCGEKFQGTFNGAGKTISNFTVNSSEDSASLFGLLDGSAVVRNLVIKNATVNSAKWTGIIAGGAQGTAVVIENIYVDKDVMLNCVEDGGGILGGVYGSGSKATVKNCVFAGTVVCSGKYAAGIVGNGNSKNLTITQCMNLGSIEGTHYVAGIATSNANLTISNCVNVGKITADFCPADIYAGNPSGETVSVVSCYWMNEAVAINTKEETSNGGTVKTEGNKRIELADLIGENATVPEGFAKRAGDYAVPAGVDAFAPVLLTEQLYDGASVRLNTPTGLRFTAILGGAYLNAVKAANAGKDVTFGIMIAPTDYVEEANGEFTAAALDALSHTTAYVMIPANTLISGGEEAGYYEFSGVLANIKDYNYTREFSARAYVAVDGEIVSYSAYDSAKNSRSVAYVAEMAYGDTATELSEEYAYEIIDQAGVYSPYTTDERKKLADFFR